MNQAKPLSTAIDDLDIAIIGMAGRFPGANTLEQFWHNLQHGVESISFLSEETLQAAGVTPEQWTHPHYVKASSQLDDIEWFDASFFGLSPREAEIMDPQHRLFLECAWEALETAGYVPEGSVGVYAGANMNSYLINLYSNQNLVADLGEQITFGNSKDFMPTRLSYKLNLHGPSLNIQTACSTSLVAVHVACQSLLNQECDMALAGGVSVKIPQTAGYQYREDDIFSPDGHCRAFDAQAQGTIFGSGVGVVVLKRLAEAIAAGDSIQAIIKGSAINNDGALKVSYSAPSVAGQAEVIVEALSAAGVAADSISYIEAHGTGTAIGDPIEVQALTQAFRTATTRIGFCALGSVKTNVGHLVAASGIAGLIKTVLALKHRQIPPSLHFHQPNPQIDFATSPFYVNTQLAAWPSTGTPRRAGVSSFGMGGTNAHVVLQEAPPRPADAPCRPGQLLLLSAKTPSALEAATQNLVTHLQQRQSDLADIAYTLQVGRQAFNYRRLVVCHEATEAVQKLATCEPQHVLTHHHASGSSPTVVFMFPGQGAQYAAMGRGLYETEPVFRQQIDQCCQLLKPHLDLDLREVLYPASEKYPQAATDALSQTGYAQVALFVVEYALAQLWMSWGVQPEACIGHSLGEYVAATLAGVFTLEDALGLIAARGRLMQQLPAGAMLSVQASIADLPPFLAESLTIASDNSPCHCVLAGAVTAIAQAESALRQAGIRCRQLAVSHAFHSADVDPILDTFAATLQTIALKPPRLPFLSNVSGTWIHPTEASDPRYWVRHLRQSVRFRQGISEVLRQPARILLEVGPGQTLSTFAKQQAGGEAVVLTTMRPPQAESADRAVLLRALGQFWLAGGTVDWARFNAPEQRQRVPLPTYPFERQRYWIDRQPTASSSAQPSLAKKADIADWFYIPIWKQSVLTCPPPLEAATLLIFADELGLSDQLAHRLQSAGQVVIVVEAGERFERLNRHTYRLNPAQAQQYDQLLQALSASDRWPDQIIHSWTVTPSTRLTLDTLDASQTRGFYSLLFLAQALGRYHLKQPLPITVISSHLQRVLETDSLCPDKATLLGPLRVIEQEYPDLNCRSIDVSLPALDSRQFQQLVSALLVELQTQSSDRCVAYRGQQRWVQVFEPLPLSETEAVPQLRSQGVYLITGGLGGIGLTLAAYLAKRVQARLILIGRSAFPDKADWPQWLEERGLEDETSQKIQSLQRLEATGAKILVIRADVTHLAQMQAAIAQSLACYGTLHGVIHAAGLPGGGVIQQKTRHKVESVLAPKVKGTLILHQLCQDLPLDFFLLCSSLNSVIGGVGQVDYCAANAFLDAFAHAQTDADGPLIRSLNWDAWQSVGMAAEGDRSALSPSAAPARAVDHPLLDTCLLKTADRAVYATDLTVKDNWVLSEHRLQGKAVLVGTAYLEMARAAVADYRDAVEAIALQDVYFLSPLEVEDTGSKQVQIHLQRQGEAIDFVIQSLSATETNQWQVHAKGTALCLTATQDLATRSITAIAAQCQQQTIVISPEAAEPASGRLAEFGPRWTNLQQIQVGQHQALATLELPACFRSDLAAYSLHPALLDLATGFMRRVYGGVYLPFSYKQLIVKRSLPSRLYSYVQACPQQDTHTETLTFDVQLLDEQGKELVTVHAFTMRKVKLAAGLAQAGSAKAISAQAFAGGSAPTLAATASPQAIAQRGLTPEEGIEVLRRGLQARWPQLLISTRDLAAVMAQKQSALWQQASPPAPTNQQPSYPRPQMGTAYVAPRTPIEQKTAEIWQQYLGITNIGIHDPFFELGGDSLLATQVISAMRQAFAVDLPLHSLFETPTVAQQSHQIQQLQAQATASGAAARTPIQQLNRSQALSSANLDQLSEQEIDALLNQMLAEEVNS
ncbi:type I polyketide synthase [Almyronema epifaneia]|uniref:SDR family NAD(P)-dependent oxidoreductase n=1 Tax=Almyronema epifaneia S1 TaxID=2991925 RepID=A0ABW6IK69_9CYAN